MRRRSGILVAPEWWMSSAVMMEIAGRGLGQVLFLLGDGRNLNVHEVFQAQFESIDRG
jgi:hypothetical protein